MTLNNNYTSNNTLDYFTILKLSMFGQEYQYDWPPIKFSCYTPLFIKKKTNRIKNIYQISNAHISHEPESKHCAFDISWHQIGNAFYFYVTHIKPKECIVFFFFEKKCIEVSWLSSIRCNPSHEKYCHACPARVKKLSKGRRKLFFEIFFGALNTVHVNNRRQFFFSMGFTCSVEWHVMGFVSSQSQAHRTQRTLFPIFVFSIISKYYIIVSQKNKKTVTNINFSPRKITKKVL